MIQRIQTLYLLLVVALGITLLFLPVLQFVTPEDAAVQQMWEMSPIGVHSTTPVLTDGEGICLCLSGWWGLTLATALIPLLALVDIFLYRKRLLQARLNIFTALMCLGWYGVLAIMVWFARMNFMVDWHILLWACLPLICLVFTMMATRRILKDEALVRAADRIR